MACDAADLAGLPGAASFGMYSLHVSSFSYTFLKSDGHVPVSLEDDPPVFFIAPLFAFGLKARDWALQYGSCFMTVVPEPRGIYARALKPRADLNHIRQWVQHCNRCHTHEDCNASGRPRLDEELTVVDCETRKLVALPASSPYVTLSYVWGAGPAEVPKDQGLLSGRLPQLIEDAIKVTMSLGYRFLWIDRYCISESSKAVMIQNMDSIYSESCLTIVASAAEDPSQGLAGMQNDRAQLPHALQMDGLGLSQINLTGLAHEVQTSKWNTRAWTYQEGFLSNRRLVFTQSQCYFECGEISCSEGLNIPLDQLAALVNNQFRTEKVFPWVADKHLPALSPTACSRLDQAEAYFVERVREYMKRHLTHESDAFDAFAGVLNYLEQFATEFLLGNILGLPLWSAVSRWSTVGCAHETLLRSLTWSISRPRIGSSDAMVEPRWHASRNAERSYRIFVGRNSAERRHEFPSWTWCGWRLPTVSSGTSGNIGWGHASLPGDIAVPVELSIEHQGGTVIDWPAQSDPAVVLAKSKDAHKASYVRVHGMLSELVIPGNCWYANYDQECQCGPYRMNRRDVQYLSAAADQRGLDATERGYVLTAWFCQSLEFNAGKDDCRTEVMILVPGPVADTYERLEVMCQIKMEYFVTRPTIEAVALRFGWTLKDFRIG